MQNFLEKLKKAKLFITFDRKDAMRAELMHFVDVHEAKIFKKEADESFHKIISHSQYAPTSRRLFRHRMFSPLWVTASMVILLVAGSGVSFAAQGSLPGDVLYPVKVNVNEKVQTALAFTPKAKVQVEQSLAETRIEEAETLAAQGRLSDTIKSDLSENFNAHAASAQARNAEIKSGGDVNGASDLDSNFESQLAAHAAIIARLSGKSSTTANAIQPLLMRVHAAIQNVRQDRVNAETEIASQNGSDTQLAAQGKINAATHVIVGAGNFLDAKAAQLGSDATVNAEGELTAASTTLGQAQAQFAAGAYADAFRLAGTALRAAQASKVFVKADTDLKLNLKNLSVPVSQQEERNAGEPTAVNFENQNEKNSSSIEASSTANGGVSSTENSEDANIETQLNGGVRLNLGN